LSGDTEYAFFVEQKENTTTIRIADIEPLFLREGKQMGRKRLIERDSEILSRYCQGYPVAFICQKFKMNASQFSKIIRRAESEGFRFKSQIPEPWSKKPSPQNDLFES
jgi:hypothetical protein